MNRFTLYVLAFALWTLAATAQADDCIAPLPESAKPVPLRTTPSASGTQNGALSAGEALSLIASLRGWYEVRLADGQPAFASKRATNVAPCAKATIESVAAGPGFEIHAIDVGTGLSILVRGADFSLLYDAGSNDDLARGDKNRTIAYVKTMKPSIVTLDHVILSHPHRDHVELLPDVITRYKPRNVWNSGAFNNICGYRNFLLAIAANASIQYRTATYDTGTESVELPSARCYGIDQPKRTLVMKHGARIDAEDKIPLGKGASMTFLYANGSKQASFNENSLVVRLDLGSRKVLLMGDSEAGGRRSPATAPSDTSIEGKLLACCAVDLKADVLIVGHHGSKTSSRNKFLDAVDAQFFIVSTGPTKYATVVLPDAEIIAELEQRGKLFRTDIEDDACLASPDKVGPDADGKPGGCDNVLATIPAIGPISVEYRRFAD